MKRHDVKVKTETNDNSNFSAVNTNQTPSISNNYVPMPSQNHQVPMVSTTSYNNQQIPMAPTAIHGLPMYQIPKVDAATLASHLYIDIMILKDENSNLRIEINKLLQEKSQLKQQLSDLTEKIERNSQVGSTQVNQN